MQPNNYFLNLLKAIILLIPISGYSQSYTLQDDDVVVDENGYIESCSYNFENSDIIIPDVLDGVAVKGIQDRVFESKTLSHLTLPSSLESIGASTFFNNNLSSLTLPNTLMSIGENAFGFNRLTAITLPPSIEEIEENAFIYNFINEIILPITEKEGYTFTQWTDSNGGFYNGNTAISNLSLRYQATLTQNITSIHPNPTLNKIEVYPNPTQGSFYVKVANMNSPVWVNIYSAGGEKISSQQITALERMDIHSERGLYFVEIISSESVKIFKVLKK